jgi:hypothetical protein
MIEETDGNESENERTRRAPVPEVLVKDDQKDDRYEDQRFFHYETA